MQMKAAVLPTTCVHSQTHGWRCFKCGGAVDGMHIVFALGAFVNRPSEHSMHTAVKSSDVGTICKFRICVRLSRVECSFFSNGSGGRGNLQQSEDPIDVSLSELLNSKIAPGGRVVSCLTATAASV